MTFLLSPYVCSSRLPQNTTPWDRCIYLETAMHRPWDRFFDLETCILFNNFVFVIFLYLNLNILNFIRLCSLCFAPKVPHLSIYWKCPKVPHLSIYCICDQSSAFINILNMWQKFRIYQYIEYVTKVPRLSIYWICDQSSAFINILKMNPKFHIYQYIENAPKVPHLSIYWKCPPKFRIYQYVGHPAYWKSAENSAFIDLLFLRCIGTFSLSSTEWVNRPWAQCIDLQTNARSTLRPMPDRPWDRCPIDFETDGRSTLRPMPDRPCDRCIDLETDASTLTPMFYFIIL